MTLPSSENRLTFQERCKGGALYGSLVGDAFGVFVEFSSREQRDADPVMDMRTYERGINPLAPGPTTAPFYPRIKDPRFRSAKFERLRAG